MKKTAVVFDLDGTLLDTLDDLTDAVNHVMLLHGFSGRSNREIKGFVGNGAKKLIERSIYSKNGELEVEVIDRELVDACYKELLVYYNENSNVKTAPYEGVLDVLGRLCENKIPVAIVSNKPDDIVKKLNEYHFKKYISVAVGEKAGYPRKPDPSVLLAVIRDLGCDDAIYVGDSEADIRVAENAGVPSVLMTWGFRDRQTLVENGAEMLADNSGELLDELSRLLKINFGDL